LNFATLLFVNYVPGNISRSIIANFLLYAKLVSDNVQYAYIIQNNKYVGSNT